MLVFRTRVLKECVEERFESVYDWILNLRIKGVLLGDDIDRSEEREEGEEEEQKVVVMEEEGVTSYFDVEPMEPRGKDLGGLSLRLRIVRVIHSDAFAIICFRELSGEPFGDYVQNFKQRFRTFLLARRSFILAQIPALFHNAEALRAIPALFKNCERSTQTLALAEPIKNQDFLSAQCKTQSTRLMQLCPKSPN
jgi:hypothetical protein